MKTKTASAPTAKNWRVTVSIPREFQPRVKSALALEGITITQFILGAIADKVK